MEAVISGPQAVKLFRLLVSAPEADLRPFDFLKDIGEYRENDTSVHRLNQRHKLIVDPFREQIVSARVLDVACHDGRWSYVLAAAGAAEVVGVEAMTCSPEKSAF